MFPYSVKKVKTFAVIRDPISRFVSSFNFLKAGGMNEVDGMFALQHLSPFNSPEDLAEALIDPSYQGRILSYPHFARQCGFIKGLAGDVSIDCLVSLDRLQVAEQWASKQLGRHVEFKLMNVGPKGRSETAQLKRGLAVIETIYSEDLDLFRRLKSADAGV